MRIVDWLLNPTGLTAHGFCLSWSPGLVSIHAISDGLIAISYFSISTSIAWFASRRPGLRHGYIALFFIAFITACGFAHVLDVATLWTPIYGLQGLIKAATAILSFSTALVLIPAIPKMLALPTAQDLERLNRRLALRAEEHAKTAELLRTRESELRLVNSELELRVAERTREFEVVNAALRAALDDQKAMQSALEKNELEFRASFEGAAVGKLQCDPKSGAVSRVNQAFAAMLGRSREDIIGRPAWTFVLEEDQAMDKARFSALIKGTAPVQIAEQRYVRRDGVPRWARVSMAAVAGPDAGVALVVGVVEDIDDQRRAQAALQETKVALEAALIDRTNALAQRDLLLREVYHRVKNNLQIIDGILVMQCRELAEPSAVKAVADLRNRIFALGLVHQQLMGSPDLETFDVAAFLQDLVENILHGASRSEITLTVASSPLDLGLDFGIPLGLLVTELVTNSLKHGFPSGAGSIAVNLDRAPDGSIVLQVEDDGVGWSAEETAFPIKKTSLGGKIIQGLVKQMGGEMTTHGDHGARTEVRFKSLRAA